MPTGRIALRQARVAAGLTQQALADRVGVVRPEIARWEAGGRLPRVDTAVRLALALDTTVEKLWPPPGQIGWTPYDALPAWPEASEPESWLPESFNK